MNPVVKMGSQMYPKYYTNTEKLTRWTSTSSCMTARIHIKLPQIILGFSNFQSFGHLLGGVSSVLELLIWPHEFKLAIPTIINDPTSIIRPVTINGLPTGLKTSWT